MTTILFWGKVGEGEKRGKDLGFPTANIALHKKIPEGIYVSKTRIRNSWYPSLTFIGAAKTFEETKIQAETYIMFSPTPERWKAKLYGQWLTIKLLKKIRGNKKFASAEDLVKQMNHDEKEARNYFKSIKPYILAPSQL